MRPCAAVLASPSLLAAALIGGSPAAGQPAQAPPAGAQAPPASAQAPPASAQAPPASAQGDVSVTIYASGMALVQDERQIDLPRGRTTVPFADVSAMIRPETLSFSAADTAILEQNFDFDLLTPEKLIEKAVGQEVTLIRTNPATGAERLQRVRVLSTVGGVVIEVDGRIEVLRDDGLPARVIFDAVPANLRARPTLSVTLDSARPGQRAAAIRYLTPGLGWSADYVVLFDEVRGALDMQGWVTLTNTTGTTFANAATLLVAGNPAPHEGWRIRGQSDPGFMSEAMMQPGTESAARERLGDFYLYPLAARTTIASNQTKQAGFLDAKAVPAQRVYLATADWLASDPAARNASSAIRFSSARAGGLGDALPAGTVRFYQRDAAGSPQFIGESAIGHTPMGSLLTLPTGAAFDVLVQAEAESRTQISAADYERSARLRVIEAGEPLREVEVERAIPHFRTTMRYTLTNARPAPVEVELRQEGLDPGPHARDFRVVGEDAPGEQLNAGTRLYRLQVPANGTRVVRVTYETRF